ncbi:MAG: four-carbon acid sugar kinase family protein [Christensenellales bacterium]|jgi:uncharacterized protein YgbK (DUF1537 family)
MKLLVVTDDYTGALDTGVQFTNEGISTCVSDRLAAGSDVVVIDTDTRSASPNAAYEAVYGITKAAKEQGFTHFYKKLDSVMRGNIGAELSAFMDALGLESLPLLPAYPDNGRLTIGGVQYVDGVSLEESHAAKDPFSPPRYSSISRIIAQQTDRTGIEVIDASSNEDLREAALRIDITATAGCAGFAAQLAALLPFKRKERRAYSPPEEYAVISGSLHPASLEQISYAVDHGFNLHLIDTDFNSGEYQLDIPPFENRLMVASARSSDDILLTNAREARKKVGESLAQIAKEYAQQGKTLVVFGGDTLKQIIALMDLREIIPVRELMAGVVLSHSKKGHAFVSKSGGFGAKDAILQIDRALCSPSERLSAHQT